MRLSELIGYHMALRPMLQVQDVFKLLYQGNFGVGHLLSGDAFDSLQGEANSLEGGILDPLTEPVALDGTLIRVNLRPFLGKGYSIRRLYELMLKSDFQPGNLDMLISQWRQFQGMCPTQFAFNPHEVTGFRFPEQLPHHSGPYRELYAPSYRVVSSSLFENDFSK